MATNKRKKTNIEIVRKSTVHGFSGEQIALSDDELARYREFVAAMFGEYRPTNAEARHLLQQYIDLRWSLHQITVEQINLLSLMNRVTADFIAANDLIGLEKALQPVDRRLRTLGTAEDRAHRSATQILERYRETEKECKTSLHLHSPSEPGEE
jgi:hypothetical protein